MVDTKYLTQIKGVWHIRLRPPLSWGHPSTFFVKTLKTSDLTLARKFRDKYLLPVLAESEALEMLYQINQSILSFQPQLKDKVDTIKNLFEDKKEALSLRELFEAYISFQSKGSYTKATLDSYHATMVAYEKLMGNIGVDKITSSKVRSFRDALTVLSPGWTKTKEIREVETGGKVVSGTTINNHLNRFRTVWGWALKEKLIAGVCPAEGIHAPYQDKVQKKEEITPAQCDQLMNLKMPKLKNVSESTWYYFPRIARYTGARLGEIAQLHRDDFIIKDGLLCMEIKRTVKTNSSYRITPVSDKLKEIIQPLLKKKGPLFKDCGTYDNKLAHDFSKAFNTRAKKVGGHCTYHGLRSYAVSQMANAGIDKIDRERIVGHKNKDIHAIYTRDNMARLKRAVDTIR